MNATTDCIFCKIANQSIPVELVHSDEQCVAFRDIHPQAPTHLLVIPRKHVRDLVEVTDTSGAGASDEGQEKMAGCDALLGHLLRVATQAAQKVGLHADGFRVVINTGANAGQSVFHLHLHVLGGRSLGWPPG